MTSHRALPVPRTIYERAVLFDTSAYLSFVEGRPDALACAVSIDEMRVPTFVTSTVVAETHRRLLYDHGRAAARQFIADMYTGQTEIVRPTEDDEREAVRLIDKYSDLEMTFCDVLSMAVMFRAGISRAFTFDRRHFLAVGLIVVPPLYV